MTGDAVSAPTFYPRLLLVTLALLLAAAPHFIRVPEPQGGLMLDHALFTLDGSAAEAVELPHSWPRIVPSGPGIGAYSVEFTLEEALAEPLFVLIPVARHHLSATLNGHSLVQINSEPWLDPSAGAARRLRVPDGTVVTGGNRLVVTLERNHGTVPGYLSRLYLGGENMIALDHWSRAFGTERVRATAHALHILILIALATLWSARRRDPAFSWLLLIGASSFMIAIPNETNLPSFAVFIKPYLVLALPSVGLMAMGLAYAIGGARPPLWLRYSIVGVPAVLLPAVASGWLPHAVGAMLAASIAVGSHLAAAVIVAREYLRKGRWEIGLLAIPFFLVGWFGIRDVAVLVGLIDGSFLYSGFVRSLTMLAILILLMRRLARSLNELDGANDTLRQRLAEREAELSLLHEKERQRTARSVREQERQRLMHDLHDGLSGHLVSIIALSERKQADPEAIERAAREALNDLRLVINSLDIGDRDLPLALASFRERLEPQLRRLGVDLAWSMEKLPEVSGVTPANALSVLRILQEAVTNALKHGPATKIAIRGAQDEEGAAMIVVENDGRATTGAGKGHGLANMRRRAELLGGNVSLASASKGMRLALTLPLTLAEPAV